jgi:HK97 gp10 family phage protein
MGAGADRMRAALTEFQRATKEAFQVAAPDLVRDLEGQLAMRLLSALAKSNPVDTGYSSANWMLDVQAVPVGVVEAELQKSKGKPDSDAIVARVMTRAAAILDAKLLAPDIIHISNNVEYVPFLEDGSSQQKPEGFIAHALERFRVEAENFIREQLERGGGA